MKIKLLFMIFIVFQSAFCVSSDCCSCVAACFACCVPRSCKRLSVEDQEVLRRSLRRKGVDLSIIEELVSEVTHAHTGFRGLVLTTFQGKVVITLSEYSHSPIISRFPAEKSIPKLPCAKKVIVAREYMPVPKDEDHKVATAFDMLRKNNSARYLKFKLGQKPSFPRPESFAGLSSEPSAISGQKFRLVQIFELCLEPLSEPQSKSVDRYLRPWPQDDTSKPL